MFYIKNYYKIITIIYIVYYFYNRFVDKKYMNIYLYVKIILPKNYSGSEKPLKTPFVRVPGTAITISLGFTMGPAGLEDNMKSKTTSQKVRQDGISTNRRQFLKGAISTAILMTSSVVSNMLQADLVLSRLMPQRILI